jgi:hypothetical protein
MHTIVLPLTVTSPLRVGTVTNWNVWPAFQHYWTPAVRTSLYGGYAEFHANSDAVDRLVCTPLHNQHGGTTSAVVGSNLLGNASVSASGCADWAAWAIGSRTLWNPVKNLDVGVDVLYTQMSKSAFAGATVVGGAGNPGGSGFGAMTVGDTHIWAGILRVQYNFYP